MSAIKTVPPLILLWGPEDYLLEMRLQEIIEELKQIDGYEPEVVSLNTAETKPLELEQYLAEVPLFSHRRVVLMRHPPWLEKPAKSGVREWEAVIGSFVRSQPHQLHLVLTADKKPGSRGLDELIKKSGEALEVPGIGPRQLADWIVEELKKSGVKIQREAVEVLVKSGRDMNYLATELERLALCHRGQTVTTADLTGIESDLGSFSVFQLTDALLRKNTRDALQALASLLQKGEPVTLIVHMITRELLLLGKVQALASRGEPSSAIARLLGKQPFRIDKMLRSSMTTEDLKYALKRLAEIDYAVKNTSQDHRLLLETMIVEICENRRRMLD